ncbi:hypothetical protein K439DRAFT_1613846 [Ramaria rubella]|nr:hypothetical protein K439DRAFT_1613846 [Ramaria rubella]
MTIPLCCLVLRTPSQSSMPNTIFQAVDSDLDQEEANNNQTGLYDSDDSDSSQNNNSDNADITITTRKATGHQHCHAQEAHINSLQTELAAAMHQIAMLLNKAPADGHKAKSAKGLPPAESPQAVVHTNADVERLTNICQLGGKFIIMYLIWISNVSMSFCTKLNPNYSPEDCFQAGLEWKQQGEQADLHAAFPPELHGDFKHDFIHTMHGAMKIAVCVLAGLKMLMILHSTTHLHRSYIETLLAALKLVLLHVFLVIIWGLGTLNCDPGIRSRSKTVDQIWGLTEITPGAIAASAIPASAILVCFALSEDALLQPQGSVTKINYEVDFYLYLKFLISSLTGGKKMQGSGHSAS